MVTTISLLQLNAVGSKMEKTNFQNVIEVLDYLPAACQFKNFIYLLAVAMSVLY